MIFAERDTHRLRTRRDDLAQFESCVSTREQRHGLRSKVHDGNQFVVRRDATGVSARSALAERRHGFEQHSSRVEDEQLIIDVIGRRHDDWLASIGCKRRTRGDQQTNCGERYRFHLHAYPLGLNTDGRSRPRDQRTRPAVSLMQTAKVKGIFLDSRHAADKTRRPGTIR